ATEAPPVVGSIGAPANGGSVAAGRVFRVAWTASDDVKIATQEIWLSLDDGSTWTQLVGDVPGNRFTWNWNVPTDLASDRARLRIVARDGSAQPGERTTGRFSIGRATPARLQRSLR
ncbi:MAG: Ig-like domain-containing protein, partial [Alphaproteobacteria bacterium]